MNYTDIDNYDYESSSDMSFSRASSVLNLRPEPKKTFINKSDTSCSESSSTYSAITSRSDSSGPTPTPNYLPYYSKFSSFVERIPSGESKYSTSSESIVSPTTLSSRHIKRNFYLTNPDPKESFTHEDDDIDKSKLKENLDEDLGLPFLPPPLCAPPPPPITISIDPSYDKSTTTLTSISCTIGTTTPTTSTYATPKTAYSETSIEVPTPQTSLNKSSVADQKDFLNVPFNDYNQTIPHDNPDYNLHADENYTVINSCSELQKSRAGQSQHEQLQFQTEFNPNRQSPYISPRTSPLPSKRTRPVSACDLSQDYLYNCFEKTSKNIASNNTIAASPAGTNLLLPRLQTILLYKENADRIKDPEILFQFSCYILNVALTEKYKIELSVKIHFDINCNVETSTGTASQQNNNNTSPRSNASAAASDRRDPENLRKSTDSSTSNIMISHPTKSIKDLNRLYPNAKVTFNFDSSDTLQRPTSDDLFLNINEHDIFPKSPIDQGYERSHGYSVSTSAIDLEHRDPNYSYTLKDFYNFDTVEYEKRVEEINELFKMAYKYLRKSATQNHTDSQYLLGEAYSTGMLTDKKNNQEEAFKWFNLAAEKRHPEACFRVALCYENGYGVSANVNKFQQFLRLAASQSHSSAMLRLGLKMFYSQMGFKETIATKQEGIKWLTRASETATTITSEAPYQLGLIYESGFKDIIIKNMDYSLSLYQKSSDLGYIKASKRLGEYYKNVNPGKSLKYYTKAGLAGDISSMVWVAGWYIPRNELKAFEWVKRCAIAGHAKSQFLLARMYERGVGCFPNLSQSKKWYTLSANNGYKQAILRQQHMHAFVNAAGKPYASVHMKEEKDREKCIIM